MLNKVDLLNASFYSQRENASHPFRRAELTHAILADDVVSSRRGKQKERPFTRFANAICQRKSLRPQRNGRQNQHAQTHYEKLLHNDSPFGGAVR